MSSENWETDTYRRAGSLRMDMTTMLSRSPVSSRRSRSGGVPWKVTGVATAAGRFAVSVATSLGRRMGASQMACATSSGSPRWTT